MKLILVRYLERQEQKEQERLEKERKEQELIEEREKRLQEKIEQDKKQRTFLIIFSMLLIGTIIAISLLWLDSKEAEQKTQQLLYKNTIQQGKLYCDYLDDPLKSKLIFADAIFKSTNEVEYKNGQILYHSSFKTNIYLNSIKEHNDSVYGATFSKDEQQILSWSRDGNVKLHKLYGEMDKRLTKEDYVLRVEVETGVRLESSREIRGYKANEWLEQKEKWEKRLKELNQ